MPFLLSGPIVSVTNDLTFFIKNLSKIMWAGKSPFATGSHLNLPIHQLLPCNKKSGR